ncbi:alpha/beta hydrolase [Streptomyces sp. KM273126]|uniref:alpha/beta hydrolase n=1 Tax=Streptomyces sp. KM273126 TaxID=2545247 RepID=UPI00215D74D5|nr:alpha/beta hydrolase [Streptomyces sp. KM273126]
MYEPGVLIDRVSPTPLLMIVGEQDTVTLTDTGLAAYNRALEPKQLVTIPGGHFAPYTTEFAQASAATTAFFREHLTPGGD